MERPPGLRYQPFYCEENAWWLCAEPSLGAGERWVIFVTSRAGRVPMLEQRAAPPGRLIAWDYHVVVADSAGRVWDLDTRLPLPSAGLDWISASFALADRLPAIYAPRLRIVAAEAYRRDFASDRRHMRDSKGRWRYPLPPWPPIGSGMTLPHYLDIQSPEPGILVDLQGGASWLVARSPTGPR